MAHIGSPYFRVLKFDKAAGTLTEVDTFTLEENGSGCAFNPDGDRIGVAFADSPFFRVLALEDVSSEPPTWPPGYPPANPELKRGGDPISPGMRDGMFI